MSQRMYSIPGSGLFKLRNALSHSESAEQELWVLHTVVYRGRTEMHSRMPSQGCEDRKQNREEIGLEASPSPPPPGFLTGLQPTISSPNLFCRLMYVGRCICLDTTVVLTPFVLSVLVNNILQLTSPVQISRRECKGRGSARERHQLPVPWLLGAIERTHDLLGASERGQLPRKRQASVCFVFCWVAWSVCGCVFVCVYSTLQQRKRSQT